VTAGWHWWLIMCDGYGCDEYWWCRTLRLGFDHRGR
jgi:hypothetical protein